MRSVSNRNRIRLGRWFGLLMLVALLGTNIVLLKQALDYRSDILLNRLDPIGLSLYPPTIDRQELKNQPSKLLVLFGDSRAARWPAPSNLPQWVFINRGAEAQTTAQALLRFDYHVESLRPDIVLVQVGINDLKTIPPLNTERVIVFDANALLVKLGSNRSLYQDGLHLNDQGCHLLNDQLIGLLATLP